jgi:hypothetical protein
MRLFGRTSPPRGCLLTAALIVLAVASLIVLRFTTGGGGGEGAPSSAANLTPRAVDGRTGGPGTDEYNQMIEALDEAGAEEARGSGASFVATPVGRKPGPGEAAAPASPAAEPSGPEVVMAPRPMGAGAVRPSRAGGADKPPEARPDDERAKMIAADLKGLGAPSPGAFAVSRGRETGPETAEAGPMGADRPSSGLAPGDLLMAATELAVVSEVQAPVVARVIGGRLDGARFLGVFKQVGESLSLSFDRLADRRLGLMEIEALGVDPMTDSPAIGGKVDRHLLSRWGGLLASSFLEGLGGALADRGTEVTVSGDLVVRGRGDVRVGDAALEALGQVGSRASTQLEKGFDRPPTVTVPAGSPVGILILSVPE